MGDRNTGISRDQLRDYTLKRQDLSPDGLVWQEPVIDKDLATPPGSGVAEDDRYLIISGSGDWSGHDNDIAHYHNGQWNYYTPIEGWFAWVNDEDKLYRFDGSSWAEFEAGGGAAGSSTYTNSFVNGDLSTGILTVTHNLGMTYPLVAIYNDSGEVIQPDEITYSNTNTVLIDLSSYGTITGTWNVRVVGGTWSQNLIKDDDGDTKWEALEDYLQATVAGEAQFQIEDGIIKPLVADLDLGDASNKFRNAFFSGKLTVDGLIDPTGLILTPQGSNPLGSNKGIYIDTSDSKLKYWDGSTLRSLGAVSSEDVDDFTIKYSGGKLKIADRIELNTMLNAFRIAINGSLSQFNMVDGIIDEYEDETGIDAPNSLNEDYDSVNDLYKPEEIAELELDYMEYASDGVAQAAYVSSDEGIEVTLISQLIYDGTNQYQVVGDTGDVEYRGAQSFTLSSTTTITGISTYFYIKNNSPTGGITWRIETDSAGLPSGVLAHANASKLLPTVVDDSWNDVTFDDSFSLNAETYWLVATCDNQDTANFWKWGWTVGNPYAGGLRGFSEDGGSSWSTTSIVDMTFKIYTLVDNLQSYSEASIKNQGSYSLKAIAAITDSLNDTLTKSGLSLDLSDINTLKIDVRASRTGTNLQLQLRETGAAGTLISQLLDSGGSSYGNIGDSGGNEWRATQSFTLDATTIITGISTHIKEIVGTPINGITWRIETDDGGGLSTGKPTGTLAHSNATKNITPVGDAWNDATFDNSFELSAGYYWLVATCDNQDENEGWRWWMQSATNPYAGGRVASSSDGGSSWNLEHAGHDLTFKIYGQTVLVHTKDINITSADVFQEITWDISAIANADKDAIDSIIFKILNADSETTYYIDNFRVDGETLNMTLISNSFTAEVSPDSARIVLFEEDVDSITENTDIKAYVSRDGGSTYAQVTLSDEGNYESGKRILTGVVDLTQSGVGSGTNIEYKIETLNTKKLKLHGVGLHWD